MRSDLSSKLRARCGGQILPLRLVLTPEQARDAQGLAPLFLMLAKQAYAPFADKGRDADAIGSTPAKRTVPTRRSPPKATIIRPIQRDRGRRRLRGLIERLSDKPKSWRGVAVRFDEAAEGMPRLGRARVWQAVAALRP